MPDYTLPLDQLPDPLPIEPLTRPFDVTITPPGSKSITCRAYVLAALAEGESKIIRPLRADDTDKLLDALCTLGADARWDGEDVYIKGVAGRFPRGGEVNLGDGGTPTRFMIACACLAAKPVVVDGSARMRERPIAEGVDMLRQLGAKIEYVEEEGRLPVRVVPNGVRLHGNLTLNALQSSQFVSAIMLIAPNCRGVGLQFRDRVTSYSYINLTDSILTDWGVPEYNIMSTEPGTLPRRALSYWRHLVTARKWVVEGDMSSAVYGACAVALTPESRIQISHASFNSKQPDVHVILLLKRLGCHIDESDSGITVHGTPSLAIDNPVDASNWPDGAIVAAVVFACYSQPTTLTGLHTLRVKETDRIAALANELRKVGCEVETTDDSITITPMTMAHGRDARATDQKYPSNPVTIETYNDHRMAMAFAILGLVRPGISIRNPACVAKSYPTFWQDFAKLYQ